MPLSRLIGNQLRERRMALGLTQAGVAQAAGISPSFLNLIEHNRRRAGTEALARLADILQTDIQSLTGAGDDALIADLRAAAEGTAAELDRTHEFAGRFPGWAGALAQAGQRAARAERTVIALNDRLTHDPHLSQALHELLSALSGVRSAAGILAESEGVDPEWQARFRRNLHADAERLARGAEALVAYLDVSESADPAGVTASPQEEMDAWLAGQGWHLAAAENGDPAETEAGIAALATSAGRDMARGWLRTAMTDAKAMPLHAFTAEAGRTGPDPLRLAASFGVSVLSAFRRLATLPGSVFGLVICDAAGALTFRKPAQGFAIPRFGSACALWPLFQALAQPMQPVERMASVTGRTGEGLFRLRALAEPRPPAAFGGPVMTDAAMLIEPAMGGGPATAMGSTCRICAVPDCPARREPTILSAP